MQSLCIHPDGHYLMTASGEPFFYLGDTAWDIFQKLTLTERIRPGNQKLAHFAGM